MMNDCRYGLSAVQVENKSGLKQLACGFLVLVALCASGCTKVEPWDKGNFTKASMQVNPWSIPVYMSIKTTEKALESSKGGVVLGGGGCGCG